MSDIPGFTHHRGQYRRWLLLPPELARDVAAEARARGVPVADVLRERVARGGRAVGETEPVTIASILATLDKVGASWTSTAEPEPDPDSLGARLTAAGGTIEAGLDRITILVPGSRPDLAAEVAEVCPEAVVTWIPKEQP